MSVVEKQLLEEMRTMNQHLTGIHDELRWMNHRDLRELEQSDPISGVTLKPGETHTLYFKEKRTGEVIFGLLAATSTSATIRVYVDDFPPTTFPLISDLINAGVTANNNVLWGVNVGGGVYAMISNYTLSFERKIRIEAVNLGTTDTLVTAKVIARIRF